MKWQKKNNEPDTDEMGKMNNGVVIDEKEAQQPPEKKEDDTLQEKDYALIVTKQNKDSQDFDGLKIEYASKTKFIFHLDDCNPETLEISAIKEWKLVNDKNIIIQTSNKTYKIEYY
eukprot:761914_1